MLLLKVLICLLSDITIGNFMSIQLQPQTADLEQWSLLAQQACVAFEVLDLFVVSGSGDVAKHKKIVEQYRKTGMVKSIHGAFIDVNPASGDSDFRELSRQRCRKSCEVACELEAGNLVFHSSAFPFLRGDYLENWAAGCASFYEELVARYPVKIYIENAQDVDPTPLRKLMEKIQSDRIGVCLDIGHVNYSRASVRQWFEELGEWIQYLHLSDNMGKFDEHLPLGQGSIDWALVNRLWKSLEKDIPITLETGDLESTRESIAFLRRHEYFGLKGNVHEKF